MKKLSVVLAGLIMLAGCAKSPEGEQSDTKSEQAVKKAAGDAVNYAVDTDKSVVKWVGSKPGGEHHGTLQLNEGTVNVKNGKVTAGNFIMDMTSIVDKDLEDPKMNKKLVTHLKSEDFFSVDKFPEASFEITDIKPLSNAQEASNGVTPTHKVSGNLTVKDNTNNLTFNAKVEVKNNMLEAHSARFIIDRTKWDVNYKSKSIFDNLKDKFIHDDVALEVVLHAKK